MRIPKQYELSLDGAAFNALKADFDVLLKKTLSNMQQKGSEAAEMKISLKITFVKGEAADAKIDNLDAMRELTIPRFDHKITSAIQIKNEASGTLGGKYELVFDAVANKWGLREIVSPQLTIFDDFWEEP